MYVCMFFQATMFVSLDCLYSECLFSPFCFVLFFVQGSNLVRDIYTMKHPVRFYLIYRFMLIDEMR